VADSLNAFWASSFLARLLRLGVAVSGTSLTSQSTCPDKTRATTGRTLMAHHPGASAWARRWAGEGQARWRSCFRSAIACRRPNHERISRAAVSGRFGKYSQPANSTMSDSSTNCCHGWCIGVAWNQQHQRCNPARSVVGEQRSMLRFATCGVGRRLVQLPRAGPMPQHVALPERLSFAQGLGRARSTSAKSPPISAFGMIQRRCSF